MKYLLLISLLCLSLQGCGQNEKQNNNPKFNIAEMEKSIIDKEKSYLYKIKYEHTDCSYEILVNDVPVIAFFGLGNWSTSDGINKYILKPGKQTVTLRLYPQKIEDTLFKKSLTKDTKLKITITKNERHSDPMWAWNNRAKDNPDPTKWDILTFETPKMEDDKQAYAEYKMEFEVNPEEMNWQITGWSDGQDLRNHPNIKQEVLDFYKKIQTIIENNKSAEFVQLVTKSLYESSLARAWQSKACFEDAIKTAKEGAKVKQKFIFPLDPNTVELKFYGNGRVVTLVSKDLKSYGYSPLVAKAQFSNFPEAYTFYLYKPKGSNELEVIR
ncbi:hypothetical protein [Gilliamella sp. Lep-s21]|uniref:hypothetical protein n=1 Tax=Gilliamella sp. Lep-s21 TaxID=2687309 RepID=UPI00132513B9|nr:hypothetical protein [Gilliamella sp. Lep-s21]MWP76811.1 hypothetical protein [Gilliamella sp. Lep-s21]